MQFQLSLVVPKPVLNHLSRLMEADVLLVVLVVPVESLEMLVQLLEDLVMIHEFVLGSKSFE